jgi:hypothetical protein
MKRHFRQCNLVLYWVLMIEGPKVLLSIISAVGVGASAEQTGERCAIGIQ